MLVSRTEILPTNCVRLLTFTFACRLTQFCCIRLKRVNMRFRAYYVLCTMAKRQCGENIFFLCVYMCMFGPQKKCMSMRDVMQPLSNGYTKLVRLNPHQTLRGPKTTQPCTYRLTHVVYSNIFDILCAALRWVAHI